MLNEKYVQTKIFNFEGDIKWSYWFDVGKIREKLI